MSTEATFIVSIACLWHLNLVTYYRVNPWKWHLAVPLVALAIGSWLSRQGSSWTWLQPASNTAVIGFQLIVFFKWVKYISRGDEPVDSPDKAER